MLLGRYDDCLHRSKWDRSRSPLTSGLSQLSPAKIQVSVPNEDPTRRNSDTWYLIVFSSADSLQSADFGYAESYS
jgi:hypothetical protein